MQQTVSGQYLYFAMLSAISGNPVTGIPSGSISGSRSTDGAATIALSGPVVEAGAGLYVAKLFDWDTSGRYMGYVFTASGCVPAAFSVETDATASGRVFAASGSITSGVIASGIFVTATASVSSGSLFLASGSIFLNTFASGVVGGGSGNLPSAWSGGTVVVGFVLSGVLSGQQVTLASGAGSGTFYLASGSIFMNTFASGVVGGGSGNFPSAWGGSGAATVGQSLDKSGYTVGTITSGILSGQPVTPVSGQVFLASGSVTSGVIASGIFVTANATVTSGQVWLASGSITSGVIASGIFVTATAAAPNSGTTYLASGSVPIASLSGLNAVVPPATLSGVVPAVTSGQVWLASGSVTSGVLASGVFVSVLPASISGVQPASGASAVVPPATLSGVFPASGVVVSVVLASVSGVQAASGVFATAGVVLDKSGYTLHKSGLDTVQVESGMNARQALSVIAAAAAGRLSGAGTSVITIEGANASGTVRVSGLVDSSGNRLAVVLNLPA